VRVQPDGGCSLLTIQDLALKKGDRYMATERDESTSSQATLGSRGGGDVVSKSAAPKPAEDKLNQETDSKKD